MSIKPVYCKYCDKVCEWRQKKDGKYYLAEKDGMPHFRICKEAPFNKGKLQ